MKDNMKTLPERPELEDSTGSHDYGWIWDPVNDL
jgi:hypothetical protein